MFKEAECPICFEEESTETVTTHCGHSFHEHCIDEYIAFNRSKRSVECPVCRAVIFENIEVVIDDAHDVERMPPPIFDDIDIKMIGVLLLGLILVSVLIFVVLLW